MISKLVKKIVLGSALVVGATLVTGCGKNVQDAFYRDPVNRAILSPLPRFLQPEGARQVYEEEERLEQEKKNKDREKKRNNYRKNYSVYFDRNNQTELVNCSQESRCTYYDRTGKEFNAREVNAGSKKRFVYFDPSTGKSLPVSNETVIIR